MSIAHRMTSDDVDPFLTGLIKSLGMGPNETRPPLERWGKYYIAQIPPMFRRSGRGQIQWKGLAQSTRTNYRARGIHGSQPLFRTGGLMHSVKTEGVVGFGRFEQHVYSDHPLVNIHQRGAEIAPHEIRPRNKKALRFRVGGQWIVARKVRFPGAIIPARPILFITAQDEAEATKLLRQHILKLVEKGWKYTPSREMGAA